MSRNTAMIHPADACILSELQTRRIRLPESIKRFASAVSLCNGGDSSNTSDDCRSTTNRLNRPAILLHMAVGNRVLIG